MGTTEIPVPGTRPLVITLWFVLIAGLATAAVYWSMEAANSKTGYAAVILAIPVLLLSLTLHLNSRLFTFAIALGELAKAIALIQFYRLDRHSSPVWVFFPLVISCLLMVVTVLLARSVSVRFNKPKWFARLINHSEHNSRLLTWAAFILFLQIGTLLALTLGVHDKLLSGYALAETRPVEDYSNADAPGMDQNGQPLKTAKLGYERGCPNANPELNQSCIDRAVVARMFRDPAVADAFGNASSDASSVTGNIETVRARTAVNADRSYSTEGHELLAHNLGQLHHLSKLVHKTCPDFSKKQPPCTIAILGHASDDIGVAGSEGNDALAALRAEEVHSLLEDLFRGKNITWIVRSVSNRDEHLDPTGQGFQPNTDHKLAVEVRVETGDRLTLLDYLYFMVYTITTTGYGDLVPISGMAQFIATLANVYEVFFVVILLNMLIIARNKNEPEKSETTVPAE
jgi:hypothetical protein